MAKVKQTPRISVNKLGEYLVSRAGRQTRILRNQKFPPEFIVPFYKDSQESISRFLASNMENISILEQKIQMLGQSHIETVWDARRISNNIDAIEAFINMLDEIDLKETAPRLGEHAPQTLLIQNVEVSVRPDVVLTGVGKKETQLVGGIKLHFPRTNPLSKEAAGYVSAAMHLYCDTCLPDEGEPFGPYCMVMDIGSQTVWPGIKSYKSRQRDIQDACAQIAALWPSITP